jgi:hypothetical protein
MLDKWMFIGAAGCPGDFGFFGQKAAATSRNKPIAKNTRPVFGVLKYQTKAAATKLAASEMRNPRTDMAHSLLDLPREAPPY